MENFTSMTDLHAVLDEQTRIANVSRGALSDDAFEKDIPSKAEQSESDEEQNENFHNEGGQQGSNYTARKKSQLARADYKATHFNSHKNG